MLDASSISVVTDVLRPERTALLELLGGLSPDDWSRPTECPAYSVQGIASHILGDDVSVLSRQRDAATNGLLLMAADLPGADFRTLLDAFNDRWVTATGFLSTRMLITLLDLVGEESASYYETVDPESPGEPVGLYGASSGTSPFWQAIAREYLERWAHHSQIRRALGLGSVDDPQLMGPGVAVIASMFGFEVGEPDGPDGTWRLGDVTLGASQQTATILTRGLPSDEVAALLSGPDDLVALVAAVTGRPA